MKENFFIIHRCLFGKLKFTELFVLAYIDAFSARKGASTSASADYIAKRLQMSVSSVKRSTAILEKLGLIQSVRHKAKLSEAKWSRQRNEYQIVKSVLDMYLNAWKKDNRNMPDKVVIPENAIRVFKHSPQCIIASVLFSIQKAADSKKEYDFLYGFIAYKQSEIAKMCGCCERVIRDTLKEFEKHGYIDKFDAGNSPKKARFYYKFTMPNTGINDTSHTGTNDTSAPEQMTLVNNDVQHEMDNKKAISDKHIVENQATGTNDTSTPEQMTLVTPERMSCKERKEDKSSMNENMNEAQQAERGASYCVENSNSENRNQENQHHEAPTYESRCREFDALRKSRLAALDAIPD